MVPYNSDSKGCGSGFNSNEIVNEGVALTQEQKENSKCHTSKKNTTKIVNDVLNSDGPHN
jgi:hypothetical protein